MFAAFSSAPMVGPLPWPVKSVTFDGKNITDVPLNVAAVTDSSTIQIVMTDKQTTLSGTARNTGGQPVIDYTVVVFPSQLREGAMPGRYTRVVRPDQQGRFETRALPPDAPSPGELQVALTGRSVGSGVSQRGRDCGETVPSEGGAGGHY